MATVIVPDVDDAALRELRHVAETEGCSLEQLVRALIEARGRDEEARRRVRAAPFLAQLSQLREMIAAEHGMFDDTTAMIREDRAAW